MAVPGGGLDTRDLAGRVEDALARRGWSDREIRSVQPLSGGASSFTFHARVAPAMAGVDELVIKVAPPGLRPVRNRDVLRHARILDRLAGTPGVPVPAVLGTDAGEPPDVPPLFVMSHVVGEAAEASDHAVTPVDRDTLRQRNYAAVEVLAALHAVPVDLDLAAEASDLVDEVERWTRALATVDSVDSVAADKCRARLLETIPVQAPPALLHGDFRLGNLLCVGSSVVAVVDWEIWSVGDPRLDLAWFLLRADAEHPGSPSDRVDHLPSDRELLARYAQAGSVPLDDMSWFAALVRYKQAATAALISKHNERADEPEEGLVQLGEWVPSLLSHAYEYLEGTRRLEASTTTLGGR